MSLLYDERRLKLMIYTRGHHIVDGGAHEGSHLSIGLNVAPQTQQCGLTPSAHAVHPSHYVQHRLTQGVKTAQHKTRDQLDRAFVGSATIVPFRSAPFPSVIHSLTVFTARTCAYRLLSACMRASNAATIGSAEGAHNTTGNTASPTTHQQRQRAQRLA